jgi:DNA polymerase III subunit delta'
MWTSIIGHDRQIENLKRALAAGHLPNAYLFCGPHGIGKRRTADAFAAALLCPAAAANAQEPCGTCAACVKCVSGNHPDLFVVEPALSERGAVQSIKIDTLRELSGRLQFHPLEATAKLAIIDGADRMMEAAANSLLKILEEPPAATHFILITPYPERLLPTIRSRCQRIAFSPLADTEIAAALTAQGSLSKEEAIRIARLAGGSLGTALRLDSDFVEAVMGRFLPLAGKGASADIIDTAQAWKEFDAEHTPLVFDLLASWYRDLLLAGTVGEGAPFIHPEAARHAGRGTPARLIACLAKIDAARAAADTAANKQLMFEELLFTLLAS